MPGQGRQWGFVHCPPGWGCSLCRNAVLLHPPRAHWSSSAEENRAGRGSRGSLASSREGVLGAVLSLASFHAAGGGWARTHPASSCPGTCRQVSAHREGRSTGTWQLAASVKRNSTRKSLHFFFSPMLFETLKDTGQIIDVEKCESNAERVWACSLLLPSLRADFPVLCTEVAAEVAPAVEAAVPGGCSVGRDAEDPAGDTGGWCWMVLRPGAALCKCLALLLTVLVCAARTCVLPPLKPSAEGTGEDQGPIVCIVSKQQTPIYKGLKNLRRELSERQFQSTGTLEVARAALSSAPQDSAGGGHRCCLAPVLVLSQPSVRALGATWESPESPPC